MKKLLIFGASGPTGRQLVLQALETGHEVTAVVRDPGKLDMKHPALRIEKGNALQPETFSEFLNGKDAVLSSIGSTERGPTTVYSQGTKNIVTAMQASGLKRLIVITSGVVGIQDAEGPSRFMRWLLGTVLYSFLKDSYIDMKRMEDYLQTVHLDWTIVRPEKLNNKPFSGKYHVMLNKNIIRGYNTSRADLAHYMLSIIDDSSTFRGTAIIAS
jgi:putative NADH-flavin reductase